MNMRIGNGYDVHALAEGLPLWLGGVLIDSPVGCVAHSDGDVAIHALCDALLGALALGDIGKHFPDTDDDFKDADSLVLLKKVVELIKLKGYKVNNIDATVIAQAPKLAPYIDDMRENIALALGINVDCVSVKATTEEKLGFTGAKEGISAHCVCLLERKDKIKFI